MEMDFTEKLIEKIQQHPILYDYRVRDYKNSKKKDRVWDQIAKELNISTTIIKNRFKNLKDGYCKYKKVLADASHRMHSSTPGDKKAYSNWIWGPYLGFLEGAIQPRRNITWTVPVPEPSRDAESDTEVQHSNNGESESEDQLNTEFKTEVMFIGNEVDAEFDPSYMDNNSRETESQAAAPRKRKLSETQDTLDRMLSYIEGNETKDSIDLLFASYAKSIKRMRPKTQASVKIKLAQIFAEAEIQDLQTDK